jgi:hypothetical protein
LRQQVHEPLSAPQRQRRLPTIETAWAAIAVFVPTIVTFLTPTLAIDLAYQIRAGELMLDSHRVLSTDPFTFTMAGQPWLNQQWGAQVLLGFVFRAGGWPLIVVLRGALIAGIVWLLYLACRGRGVRPRTAALLTLTGWLSGIEILGQLRPQLFGLLLFSLCVWALATRQAHPKRVWIVPIAVLPWASLHGSFPLAIVLLAFAWLEDRADFPTIARSDLLAAVAALAISFVNPYGFHAWTYIWDLSTNPVVSKQVSEWGPPSIKTWTGFFFFASLLAVGAFFARRERRVGWLPLLQLGTFAVLALLAGRGVAWWGLYAPVVLAGVISDGGPDRPANPGTESSGIPLVVIGALTALLLLSVPTHVGTDPADGGPAALLFAPEQLVAAAESCAPPGAHIYASQVYASWTEFSATQLPVMVDSRIELFPIDVWRDYFTVTNGQDGWQDVLDRWRVEALIVHRGQSEGLESVIRDDPGWRVVMDTEAGKVYARAGNACLGGSTSP